MNRRRILLSYLANSFSWELYSKVYFYNELIPTTINGKNVLNKAKIVKISGNGVIENQLVNKANYKTNSNAFTADTTTGKIEFNLSTFVNYANAISTDYLMPIVSGHKYLFIGFKTTSTASGDNSWWVQIRTVGGGASGRLNNQYEIFTSGQTGNADVIVYIYNGFTANDKIVGFPQLIDLTLMFGTGNEPTSLTDNRIQNILNRGYIPFNLGKYKESDIGVVSSEPYNLFDGELEIGSIGTSDGQNTSNNNHLRSKNYIGVVGGNTYTLETNLSTSQFTQAYIYEYDENYSYLTYQTFNRPVSGTVNQKTFSQNTRYVRFRYYGTTNLGGVIPSNETCFHLTGTRTGYAEHKSFTPITFKAQLGGAINSHNTMEITNSAYVFTRNQWKVDLGTLDYQYKTDNTSNLRFISTTLSTMNKLTKPTQPNLLCEGGYTSVSGTYFDNNGSVDKIIRIDDDLGRFVIRNLAYTDSTTFKSSLSGTYAHYPLATPQVITIPKKHLGIVDLGSLTGYVSDDKYYISAEFFGISTPSSNNNGYSCYCEDYMVDSGYNVYNKTTDKTMCLTSPFIGGNFIIWDSSFVGKTTNEIKALLSGKYLFFKAENEVADIENVIDIESGGTITTDSEVLANIELSVKCK